MSKGDTIDELLALYEAWLTASEQGNRDSTRLMVQCEKATRTYANLLLIEVAVLRKRHTEMLKEKEAAKAALIEQCVNLVLDARLTAKQTLPLTTQMRALVKR